jgi:hypothetical protein
MAEKLSETAWRARKALAEEVGMIDIGYGDELPGLTGLSPCELIGQVRRIYYEMSDGFHKIMIHRPSGDVVAYIRKNGCMVDVGSRQDFLDFGWKAAVEALDAL